jgi:hypothetical protein
MSKAVAILKYTRVNVPKIIFDRSDWVKYLVVFDWQKKLIDEEVFAAITGEKFNQFVREHVNSYMVNKKAPPKEIAGAIYNIVDDMLSGREPTLRAGDYIALQNFMRRAPVIP